MAPLDTVPPLLSVGAPGSPGSPGQGPSGIWSPSMMWAPGLTAPVGSKELLSTSVLRAGEARAQFTSRTSLRKTTEDSTESEADKRPYRPGEMLQQTAKLMGPDPKESPAPSVGALTPERLARTDSEGGGSSGDSDTEGVVADLSGVMHFEDASRENRAPTLGSPGMPTVGSVGHWFGTCKPCAFAFKGCQNGSACQFCHLCLPGEKQRRRKLSKMAHKEMWMHVQR